MGDKDTARAADSSRDGNLFGERARRRRCSEQSWFTSSNDHRWRRGDASGWLTSPSQGCPASPPTPTRRSRSRRRSRSDSPTTGSRLHRRRERVACRFAPLARRLSQADEANRGRTNSRHERRRASFCASDTDKPRVWPGDQRIVARSRETPMQAYMEVERRAVRPRCAPWTGMASLRA